MIITVTLRHRNDDGERSEIATAEFEGHRLEARAARGAVYKLARMLQIAGAPDDAVIHVVNEAGIHRSRLTDLGACARLFLMMQTAESTSA